MDKVWESVRPTVVQDVWPRWPTAECGLLLNQCQLILELKMGKNPGNIWKPPSGPLLVRHCSVNQWITNENQAQRATKYSAILFHCLMHLWRLLVMWFIQSVFIQTQCLSVVILLHIHRACIRVSFAHDINWNSACENLRAAVTLVTFRGKFGGWVIDNSQWASTKLIQSVPQVCVIVTFGPCTCLLWLLISAYQHWSELRYEGMVIFQFRIQCVAKCCREGFPVLCQY